MFVVSTLAVIESVTGASINPWFHDAPHVRPYITPSMRGTLELKFPPGFAAKVQLAHAEAAVGALHRTGISILVGTDAPAPGLAHGLSLHHELELLVLSGLTPREARASATLRTGARLRLP